MRFSAIAVAALASTAAAWRPGRPSWGFGNHGGSGTVSTVTFPAPTATGVPVATSAVAVTPTATIVPVEEEATTPTTAAPAATSAASSASGLTADQQAGFDSHNAARSAVGVSALQWDASLAADAQEWANHLLSVGSLVHSGVSGQGENLYWQSNTGSPFANAATAWISEKSAYNGETITSTNYMNFGHYTQIVWSSTTKVGMAVASNSKGTYVVARYSPPGNYIGEKPY